MKNLKIVFYGTPDFATASLQALVEKGFVNITVVTAPDRPAGRGRQLNFSSVKQYALSQGLTVWQPENLKSTDFLEQLQQWAPNLQVVVAFRMLPKAVWTMPKFGTFNLHASLLPDYRGAAPINWAIINGEEKTGVTTFFIDDKIDTGAIILQKETAIEKTETAGVLHDKLMFLGAEVVLETLKLIEKGAVNTIIQPVEDTKTAYKLNRDNCKVNFNQTSKQVYDHIRGLNPYPAAYTMFKDEEKEWNVKLYDVDYFIENHRFSPGKLVFSKKNISVATTDGFIEIKTLQFPGKKKMKASELLNGIQFSDKAYCF